MDLRRLLLVISVLGVAASACRKEAPPPASPPTPGVAPKASEKTATEKTAAEKPPAAPLVYAPRVDVTVTDEGFVPAKIPAKAGEPLTLAITRKTDKTCATEIIFAGQQGKTELPLDKTIEVAYTPKQSGIVRFGCAMGMMIGGVLEVAQ